MRSKSSGRSSLRCSASAREATSWACQTPTRRLHGRILELSNHATARRLSQTLTSQLVRFQYRTVLLPGRAQRSYAEHTEIVEAIAAHDAEGAEAAMRSHLSRVAEALREHHDGATAASADGATPRALSDR
ncbi:MAG: FCD domain-containing protein [Solirubrobacteraceae bacterium]